MAEIRVLDAAERNDALTRHLALLTTAVATGRSLGPRGHHIRALGATLEAHSAALQDAMANLRGLLDQLAVGGMPLAGLSELDARFARMQDLLTALTTAACAYPPADVAPHDTST